MNEFYKSHDGDIWQAADYALGALKASDRISAEKRLLNDPLFRTSVEHWQGVFAGLDDDVEPVAPRAEVWRRIKLATKPANASSQVSVMPGDYSGVWRAATSFLSLVCLMLLGLLIYMTGGDFRPNSQLQKRLVQLEKDYETLKSQSKTREQRLEFSRSETNEVEQELISSNLSLVELSQKYELSQKNLELANYKLVNLEKELDFQVKQLQLQEKEIEAYVKELDVSAREIDAYSKALDSNAQEIDTLRAAIDKVSYTGSVGTRQPARKTPKDVSQSPSSNVPTRSPRSKVRAGARSSEVLELKVSFDNEGKELDFGNETSGLSVRKPVVYFTPNQGERAGETVAFGPVDLDFATGLMLSDEFAELAEAGGTVTLVSNDGAFKTTLAKGALD